MPECERGSPCLLSVTPLGFDIAVDIVTPGCAALHPGLHAFAPSGLYTFASFRGLSRGGSFNNNDNNLHAANRNNSNPTNENNNIGLRVAEAPECRGRGIENRPDLCGWVKLTPPCRAQGLPDRPACPRFSWAGEEEAPAVVSSRKVKGAAAPLPFRRQDPPSVAPADLLLPLAVTTRRL